MQQDSGPLAPPSLFQGLRIHALLGQGAIGWAYLASHDALRTPVIVKVFRPVGLDVLAEAHLAARIASPHVVGVLDAGVSGGLPFVVQRYVDGVDLKEILDAHLAMGRPLPAAAHAGAPWVAAEPPTQPAVPHAVHAVGWQPPGSTRTQ